MIRREYFPPKFHFVLGCLLLHGAKVTEGNALTDIESSLLYPATCSSCRTGECREREDKLKEWSCAVATFCWAEQTQTQNSAVTSYFQFSLRGSLQTLTVAHKHTENMILKCRTHEGTGKPVLPLLNQCAGILLLTLGLCTWRHHTELVKNPAT